VITLRPKVRVQGEIHSWLFVKNRWFTISIHKLQDPGMVLTDPHDHPSNFLSIGLKGRYIETVFQNPNNDLSVNSTFERRAGTFHIMPIEHAHYIHKIGKPAWTLFITWGYRGRRGYMFTEEGAIHPDEYFAKMFGKG
jgi:hypothetical protein